MARTLIQIDKDVPLPSEITIRREFYPWKEMEAGDSFFINAKKVTAMTAKAAWAGRKYQKRFVCRTVDDGVRVWCLGERTYEDGERK